MVRFSGLDRYLTFKKKTICWHLTRFLFQLLKFVIVPLHMLVVRPNVQSDYLPLFLNCYKNKTSSSFKGQFLANKQGYSFS